jgi:hypothetical protein
MIMLAVLLSSRLLACKCDGEAEGMRQAQLEAEAEAKREAASRPPATKRSTAVEGSRKVDCTQLIDTAAFQEALGEQAPVTLREVGKSNPDFTASCSVVRGGEPMTAAQQKALLKRNGKLGVLPGDELCNVTAYCNVVEDEESFDKRCTDLTLGTNACVKVVAHGAEDVRSFRFLDKDTRCVIDVRGGPSMVDNDFIATCAKAARDRIGPPQIAAPGGAAPEAPTP